MKISRLVIKDFQQFKHLDLDFTYPKGHPNEGEPLKKVCFIGRNGTGKSTILRLLDDFFTSPYYYNGFTIIKSDDNSFFISNKNVKGVLHNSENKVLLENIISSTPEEWEKLDKSLIPHAGPIINSLKFNVIYSPSESHYNPLLNNFELPDTNLSAALKNENWFSNNNHEIVSNETIPHYWASLIHHIKQRESKLLQFQNQTENQNKTIKEFREIFDKDHPKILDHIAKLWNKILDKAGLEFDAEDAKIPVQLTDNLEAYVKVQNTNQNLGYNLLSTGIRNYIFRLGHIFSYFFNRDAENGFVFIDEPENSLYPDFLYDMIETYDNITRGSQLFFATHNPIIAAQFEPSERFILDFNEEGYVFAHRGITPLGDDPNDMLENDFGVSDLMGKEGIKQRNRFRELRKMIKKETKPEINEKLRTEFLNIGILYNFDVVDGISSEN